ncbi:PI-PLC domain-containing protein [Embleya sp. NPDC127516]|uniref:PI-PLC domain-containing protein n=1 Tax=Embleya sp. NPDC127516 TaxID=3363990 RepID=UPI0037F58503
MDSSSGISAAPPGSGGPARSPGASRPGGRPRNALVVVVLALLAALVPSTASVATTTHATAATLTAAEQRWGNDRLDQVTSLTTHNSFTNYEDSRWSSVNQSESVRGQLDRGVRGLMLDTHWYEHSTGLCIISFGSDCYPSDVYLCHGDCKAFAGVTYALPRQSFAATMQTVVDFLNANPLEVVTVFLEDYVDTDRLRRSLERVRGLPELLFRPDTAGVRDTGWPRVADLVTANKRLLVFSDKPGKEGLGVMYDKEWTVQNYWSLGDLGNDLACTSRWSDVPLNRIEPGFRRLFVMSHFRNVPTIGTAALDNGTKLRDRIAQQCGTAAGRSPNFVAVDFHRQSDGSGRSPASIVAELNAG